MTKPFTGHPFDVLAMVANVFFDQSGNPVSLPGILEAEFTTITYRFDFTGLNTSESDLLRALSEDAFDQIETFTALTFTEVTAGNEGDAHITVDYNASLIGGGETQFFYRDDGDQGFDLDGLESDVEIRIINAYTVVHEIGHALTLEHTSPFQDPVHTPLLPADEQNNNFTVMHYDTRSGGISPSQGEWLYESFQIYDVYAMQLRFGENTSTGAGNSTYTPETLWGDKDGYMVPLWDVSGIDTLDFSSVSRDQLIELGEGRFSDAGPDFGANPSVLASAGDPADLDYTEPVFNLAITFGTEIENAEGGSGADIVTGNALSNTLSGNGGADTLTGEGGADVLNGGAGGDLLIGDDMSSAALASALAQFDGLA